MTTTSSLFSSASVAGTPMGGTSVIVGSTATFVGANSSVIDTQVTALANELQKLRLSFNSSLLFLNDGLGDVGSLSLWVGFFLFSLFGLIILGSLPRLRTAEQRRGLSVFVLLSVTLISYLSMALSQGRTYDPSVQVFTLLIALRTSCPSLTANSLHRSFSSPTPPPSSMRAMLTGFLTFLSRSSS